MSNLQNKAYDLIDAEPTYTAERKERLKTIIDVLTIKEGAN